MSGKCRVRVRQMPTHDVRFRPANAESPTRRSRGLLGGIPPVFRRPDVVRREIEVEALDTGARRLVCRLAGPRRVGQLVECQVRLERLLVLPPTLRRGQEASQGLLPLPLVERTQILRRGWIVLPHRTPLLPLASLLVGMEPVGCRAV